MTAAKTIPEKLTRKTGRRATVSSALRSSRREPAAANWLGPVVPAAWTAAGLASAASPCGKPARAGCAAPASAERCGLSGFLNVSRRAPAGVFLASFLRIHCCIHGDPLGRPYGCSVSLVRSTACGAFLTQVSGARRSRHLHRHLPQKHSALPGLEWAPLRHLLRRSRCDA